MSKLTILFPYQEEVTYRIMPEETWHDLGLDALIEKMTRLPYEQSLLRRVMISLTDDPRVSRFRCDVFDDLLRNPAIRGQLLDLLDHVKMFYDYGVASRLTEDDARLWDLMHRLEQYHDYILTVESILSCLRDASLRSEGLLHLRDALDAIYRDSAFAALKADVEAMRASTSTLKSITVGINVNERFEAVTMGLISVNSKPFTRSGLLKNFVNALSQRDEVQADTEWNGSMSFYPSDPPLEGLDKGLEKLARRTMTVRNPLLGLTMAAVPQSDGSSAVPQQADSAVSMLVSRLVRRLKETLGKYLNVSVKEISDLIPELLFYVRWTETLEKWQAAGWAFCKPEVLCDPPAGMEAEGFYNLKLIRDTSPDSVVPNGLRFDGEKRVYILTGANRGGKTTFTQAVGQLFLLAQSGIYVPGKRFAFYPADQVLTHFPADEDKTMDLGRLGEECSRFRAVYGASTEHSLLLLNETFSTTSFEEGYYIAVDAVRAVLDRGIRMIYNTHMHKLAYDLEPVLNRGRQGARALSLVAETTGGANSFRIRIAPPEGRSFARDIAEKYGVTYEALTGAERPPEE